MKIRRSDGWEDLLSVSGPAVTSSDITRITVLSQAEYDALDPPHAETLYLVTG